MAEPVHPLFLTQATSLTKDDECVVIVDGVWKKASIELIWATAEAANNYTETQLLDAGHAVNTTYKFAGKWTFDSTNNLLVYAQGPLATDSWLKVSDQSTLHTPS